MRVHDGSDGREPLEQAPMSRCVRRRPHRPANLLAFEINKHNVFRLELRVVHAAGLDAEDTAATVNHADIAESEVDQAEFRQLEVCLVALFLDGLVAHFAWSENGFEERLRPVERMERVSD